MGIEFRESKEEDILGIYEVDRCCFDHHWTEASYAAESNNPIANYIVAVDENKIIGFGGFWSVVDEAQITNIAVLKEYRKKGIGQKILEELFVLAIKRGCTKMTLEVREDNTSGLALYEKNGFIRAGIREKYYNNDINGIIMWRYELG
ncbi:MAG: ribosomal protein S18-alanine N-acetyltransferase [Eubacteriaceae bacterium]